MMWDNTAATSIMEAAAVPGIIMQKIAFKWWNSVLPTYHTIAETSIVSYSGQS